MTEPAPTSGCADLAALVADAGRWDDLFARALDPHPYHGRRVLAAHAAAGLAGGVRCLVAERDGRLVGLLPFRRSAAWVGLTRAHVAWASPYTTASAPLVEAAEPEAGLAALLDGMASQVGPVWLLPAVTTDDRLGGALLRQAAARGWPCAELDAFERPVLDHARRTEPRTPPKDLARRRRKLAELGPIALDITAAGPGLAAAMSRFLALEASGWKGRRGTALACRPSTRLLAERLLDEGSGPPALRIDELRLGEEVIASSIAFRAGPTAYLWKTAFDERLARFAPGLLLEEAIADETARTGSAARLNSATKPGSPLDRLFPDRERVADLVLCTRPEAGGRFRRTVAAERLRRQGVAAARRLLAAMRARRPPGGGAGASSRR